MKDVIEVPQLVRVDMRERRLSRRCRLVIARDTLPVVAGCARGQTRKSCEPGKSDREELH